LAAPLQRADAGQKFGAAQGLAAAVIGPRVQGGHRLLFLLRRPRQHHDRRIDARAFAQMLQHRKTVRPRAATRQHKQVKRLLTQATQNLPPLRIARHPVAGVDQQLMDFAGLLQAFVKDGDVHRNYL